MSKPAQKLLLTPGLCLFFLNIKQKAELSYPLPQGYSLKNINITKRYMLLLSYCTYLRFQISVRYQESSKGFFAALHSCQKTTEKHIYE